MRPSPASWLAAHGTQTTPTGVVAALIPLGLRIAAVITAATILTAIAKALPSAIRAFQDHRSDIIRAKGAARAQVIQARTTRIRARTMRRCIRRTQPPDHAAIRCLLIDQAINGEHPPGATALERLLGLPPPQAAPDSRPRTAADAGNVRPIMGRDSGAAIQADDEQPSASSTGSSRAGRS